MKTYRTWLLLLAWLCLSPAQARELVAVGTQFPRILESNVQGEPVGLAVDLLKLIASSQGHTIRFTLYPWPRAQAMVEQGVADILIGPYRTPERETRFLFSQQAFYEDALIFYARRDQPQRWRGDLAALQPYSLGLVQGWAYGDELERARARLNISTARNVETGLLMLQRGRVDLLASNERNTAPVIASLGLGEELLPLQPPFGVLRGHFAFTRNAAGQRLLPDFDRSFAQLRATGALRELGLRWKVRIPD